MIIENLTVGSLTISDLGVSMYQGEIKDISYIADDKIVESLTPPMGSLYLCKENKLAKIISVGDPEYQRAKKLIGEKLSEPAFEVDVRNTFLKFYQIPNMQDKIDFIEKCDLTYYDFIIELVNKEFNEEIQVVTTKKLKELNSLSLSKKFILLKTRPRT